MKKRFILPILLSFSSLSGCYLAAERPSTNGKIKSDYDLTNNIETVCYLGDRVETDNFFITAFFQDYRYFGGYGMCLRIEGKNKKEKKYDVVEAYLCDTYGENINYLIPEPVTYEFFDYNRGYDTVDFYVGSFSLKDSFQRDNYEYVVVTQDRTIVFHCWEKPTNYVESGLQESDYNLLNKTPIVAHYGNQASAHPGYFSISRFSGKWIDDTLRITTNTEDFDLVSVFLTDSEDGNVYKLLDTPRAYGNADKMYIDILDANQEYYESCDNKVKINIITSKQKIIFYTWKTQENGKTKDDYDLTNNIELSTYVNKEIVHDDISFKLTKKEEEDNFYSTLEITSNNPDIKSYDIVEAYTINLQGKDKHNVITAPITFDFSSTGKTVYYDLGRIPYFSWDSESRFHFNDYYDEFRIIGENINFTYHLWEDFRDHGNGKTVEDYDCSNNEIVDGYANERCVVELNSKKMDVGVEIKHVDKVGFSDFLDFDLYLTSNTDVDLVQIYATDSNNENKRIILDKPCTFLDITWDVEEGHSYFGLLELGVEDLPDDYYELCNQHVRYHIVTDCYTLIVQTYNHFVNGKSKSDYDLSNLDEYETSGNNISYKSHEASDSVLIKDKETEEYYLRVYTFCDTENGLIRVRFTDWSDGDIIDSIDIVDAYFSDSDGGNIKNCLDAPITLYEYFDSNYYFFINVSDYFEEYYALCKNNVVLHIVTDKFITHITLINDRYKDQKLYGEYIDEPIESYSEFKKIEEANAYYSFNIKEDEYIKLDRYRLMGLPYSYELTYYSKSHRYETYPKVDIFDAYLTDENGNNKLQLIDKVFRTSGKNSRLFYFFAPEYSYYLNNNKKIVLHLFTTWGNVAFHL